MPKCKQCGKAFLRGHHLKEHMWIHKQETQYINNQETSPSSLSPVYFNNSFSDPTPDQSGQGMGSSPVFYQCNPVIMASLDNSNTQTVMNIHNEDSVYQRTECTIIDNSNIHHHMKYHNEESPYQCSNRNLSITDPSYLVDHIIHHTGEKTSQSDKSGIENSNLQSSTRAYTRERPYKCSHCDMGFFQMGHLKSHAKTHTREGPPFKCTQCTKEFGKKQHLNDHIKIHTGEKPYKCTHCDKAFIRKQDMQRHDMKHTGERPCECSYCDQAFISNSDLNRHMKIHTKNTAGYCEIVMDEAEDNTDEK